MNVPPKPFICKQCHQSFFGRDNRTGNPTSRYPYILACSHTVCLMCLRSAVKKHKFFCCPTCQKETPLPEGEVSISNLLPDLYLLGILSESAKTFSAPGIRDINKLKLQPAGGENRIQSKVELNGITSSAICEECSTPAKWWCKQCQALYCCKCFDKIHKIAKKLRNHKYVPLHAQEYRSIAQKGCSEHNQRAVEFFCEDDETLVCSTCAVQGSHKGHQCVSLMEKNKSCLPELQLAITEAEAVRARMTQSLKKLECLRPTSTLDVVPKELEIREHFKQMHAALQLREAELLKQLYEYNKCDQMQFDVMIEELSTTIKEITANLSDAKMTLKCTYSAINAVSLIKELQRSKTLPSFLVPTNRYESSISVHHSQKLHEHIKQAGSIDADIHSRYTILPESELPDFFVPEPVLEDALTDSESSPSVNGSATEILLTPSESSETNQPTKFRFVPPKHTKMLRHEHVKVVHINSPASFYAQYSRNDSQFRALTDNIQKWCKNSNSVHEIPTLITEGTIYLAQYEDGVWYRAKANKVLNASSLDSELTGMFEPDSNELGALRKPRETTSGESSKTKSANEISSIKNKESVSKETVSKENNTTSDPSTDKLVKSWFELTEDFQEQEEDLSISVTPDQLVQVTYMDFGNPDVVPVFKIRNIPSKFMNHPFFAHECALWEIIPHEKSIDWSPEANIVFGKFVNRQKLLMSVIEEHGGTLYVDLNQPAHFDVSNDMPVSVREALVFMDLAQYPNNGASKELDKVFHSTKYFPPEAIQPNERVNVMVTHIDNPGDFYVMLQGGVSSYFYTMFRELQEYYSGAQGELLNVFAPRIGLPYVALYPEDEKWYRAQVEELLGGSRVRVKYIDYGNTSVIPHWNLRKVVDHFIKFPKQAVHCALADVAPLQPNWDLKCTEWLRAETKETHLQMVVHRCSTGEKHVVSLFTLGEETDTCLNALLVQNQLARSSGPGSVVVDIPKKKVHQLQQEPERRPPSIEPTLALKVVSSKFKPKPKVPVISPPKKKSNLDVLREAHNIFPKDVMSSKDVPVDPNSSKTSKPKGKSKGLPVRIIRFDNPGCFYTQTVDDEPKLKELLNELLKYHQNEETKSVKPVVGTLVSAMNLQNSNAFRAKITHVDGLTGNVKVFLLDYGREMEVPQANLKPLPPQWSSVLAYATCCSLVGLIPAGGQSWARSACEFAQERIDKFKEHFLVTKKPVEDVRDSVPVDILLKEIVPGGALEPSIVKYHILSELLLDNGFALSAEKFRRRNTKPEAEMEQTSTPALSECSESETKSLIQDDISYEELEPAVNGLPEPDEPSTSAIEGDHLPDALLVSTSDIDWKPAVLPTKATFFGYPSYVGYDGCIYVHEIGEQHDTLEHISTSLCSIFNNDRYQRPKKLVREGQTCVAQFNVDKKWYRGKVHKVGEDCMEIIFVDYGNLELVSFEDVRMFATHLDVPIQCYECELHNVRPISNNGQWPTPTLDYIHKIIVDQLMLITIKEPPLPGKRVKINITLTGGDTITNLLVKEKLAHVVQPNLMLLSGAIQNPYKCLPNPSLGGTFRVVVTHIIDPSLVCVQRPKTETPTDPVELIVNQELDEFLDMINQLAEKAFLQPVLKNPAVGMACLGQYSFDQDWYRCVITDCDEDKATVVFVDYGNSENISLKSKRLRKIPPDFMKVSAQALTCRLHGIVSPDGEWSLPAHQAMSALLFPNHSLDGDISEPVAQVMDERTPIEIILTEDGSSSQPIYQSLIDQGIIATRI